MDERWRIVIVSTALPPVQGIEALCRVHGHDPVALVTQRPRGDAASSEQRLQRFVELVSDAPEGLDLCIAKEPGSLARLIATFEPDLLMCAGFSWKLPPEALAVPRLGCVNSHPSLLPRHRGPFPVGWAVRNGDAELGLTLHRMDAEFDTGAVLAQGSVPFGDEDWTFEDLSPKLAGLAAELVPRAFERVAAGDAGDPQREDDASYAPFFEEAYTRVDWSQPAEAIHRQTRAWSFTFTRVGELHGPIADLDGQQVRLLRTSLVEPDGPAVRVECGEGTLWILEHEPVDGR